MKLIPQLWNGNIKPIVHFGVNNKQLRELEHYMERHLQKLENTLNEDEKITLEKYSSCLEEYITIITEQAFTDGFGMGTKLFAEALCNAESLMSV